MIMKKLALPLPQGKKLSYVGNDEARKLPMIKNGLMTCGCHRSIFAPHILISRILSNRSLLGREDIHETHQDVELTNEKEPRGGSCSHFWYAR
jgi:hypothetical protein